MDTGDRGLFSVFSSTYCDYGAATTKAKAPRLVSLGLRDCSFLEAELERFVPQKILDFLVGVAECSECGRG